MPPPYLAWNGVQALATVHPMLIPPLERLVIALPSMFSLCTVDRFSTLDPRVALHAWTQEQLSIVRRCRGYAASVAWSAWSVSALLALRHRSRPHETACMPAADRRADRGQTAGLRTSPAVCPGSPPFVREPQSH